MNKLAFFFSFLCLSFFIAPLVSSNALTTFVHPQTISSSESPVSPHAKLSSEKDTIDSFDVNPAQRYNITTSGSAPSSSIDSSNLKLTSNSNTSSDSYTANRALSKSDSKVEWRSSSTVSGNTSEYFRDQLGTPMTFDSSTQGWTCFSSCTVNQTNGMLKYIITAGNAGGIYQLPNFVSKNIYTNLSFNAYSTTPSTLAFLFLYKSGSDTLGAFKLQFYTTTLEQTFNLPFSSETIYGSGPTLENITFNQIYIFTSGSTTSSTFFLDNIQLLGSYNYPTMNLGTNWGFDSSKEYYYDSLDNISNFQDGSMEQIHQLYDVNTPSCTSTTWPSTWNRSSSLTDTCLPDSSVGLISSTGFVYNIKSTSGGSSTYISQDFYNRQTYFDNFNISYAIILGSSAVLSIYFTDNSVLNYTLTHTGALHYLYVYSNQTNKIMANITISVPGSPSTDLAINWIHLNTGAVNSETNSNNQYAKIVNDGLSTNQTFYIGGSINPLSIDSSIYKYFLIDFNTSTTVNDIYLFDTSNNLLCSASTGWSSGWHEFDCLLSASFWTGTETGFHLAFSFSTNVTTLFFNFIGLYDSDKGNTENWNPTNAYNYVDPQGYLVNHITSTSGAYISQSGLSINTAIYKYLTISIKADSSSNRYFGLYGMGHYIVTAQPLSSSFQTFTFDLSASSYWTGTITSLSIVFGNTSSLFYSSLDSVFTIDYTLLTAAPQQQQPFQLGLLNPTTFQPTLNVTQIYLNSSAFYWQINIYDKYQNIVAYYDSAIQSSIVSGYPAVADSKYVDNFDSSTLGWRLVGSSPYLSALDSSYLSNLLTNLNTINFGTGILSNTSSLTTSLTASLNIPTNSHWYKSGTFSVAVTGSVGYTPSAYTGTDSSALFNFSSGSVSNSTSLTTLLNSTTGTVSWYKSGTFSVAVNASTYSYGNTFTNQTLYLDVSTDGGSTWTLGVASALWTTNTSSIKTLSDTLSRYTWQNKLVYRLRDVQTGNGSAVLSITSTTETQATYKYLTWTTTTNTLYLDVSTNGGNTWTTGLDSFSWTTNDTSVSHTFSDPTAYDITNSFLEYRLRLVQTGNGTNSLSITSTTETQAIYTYIPSSATENWFSFANETSSFTSGYTTTLEIYVSKATVGDQLQWQLDTNNDGSPDCYGTISSIIVGWNSISLGTCADTNTEINNARLAIVSIGTLGEMRIDAAYLAISHVSTAISSTGWSGYYYGKIEYSTVQSSLSVELDADTSGVKLFKATYPTDFTISNQINALFALGSTFPTLYFSFVGNEVSYSQTYLDFINAPFAENTWTRDNSITTGIDNHWITGPFSNNVQAGGNGIIQYDLDVPLLDSVSGTLTSINSNATMDSSAFNGAARNAFYLYMVDKQSGQLHKLLGFVLDRYNGYTQAYVEDWLGNALFQKFYYTTNMYDSQIDFNIKLSNSRTFITLQEKTTFNINNTNTNVYFNSFVYNITALSITYPAYWPSANLSQEFVLGWYNLVRLTGTSTGGLTYSLDSFYLQTRDIFQNAIIAIVNAGGGIFAPLFQGLANALGGVLAVISRYLAQIFTVVGGNIVTGIIAGLPSAIYTALKPGFDAITNALSPILSQLASVYSILNSMYSAIGNLADQIATALGLDKLFNTLNGFIQDIGSFIWTFFIDNIAPILLAALDWLSGAAASVVSFFNTLIGLIWTGFNWVIGQFQAIIFSIFDWMLNLVNLRAVFNLLVKLFLFLVAIPVVLWLLGVALCFTFPFIYALAGDPREAPSKLIDGVEKTWGIDLNFLHLQLLGFTAKVPLISYTVVMTILFGSIYSIGLITNWFNLIP